MSRSESEEVKTKRGLWAEKNPTSKQTMKALEKHLASAYYEVSIIKVMVTVLKHTIVH